MSSQGFYRENERVLKRESRGLEKNEDTKRKHDVQEKKSAFLFSEKGFKETTRVLEGMNALEEILQSFTKN